jgi:hypothetical protein
MTDVQLSRLRGAVLNNFSTIKRSFQKSSRNKLAPIYFCALMIRNQNMARPDNYRDELFLFEPINPEFVSGFFLSTVNFKL